MSRSAGFSRVWLETPYGSNVVLRDTSKLSIEHFSVGLGKYWKLSRAGRTLLIEEHQLPCQMVQSRAEVVEHFAKDDAPLCRRLRRLGDEDEVLTGRPIRLDSDCVGERCNPWLGLLDQEGLKLASSCNLCTDPIQIGHLTL